MFDDVNVLIVSGNPIGRLLCDRKSTSWVPATYPVDCPSVEFEKLKTLRLKFFPDGKLFPGELAPKFWPSKIDFIQSANVWLFSTYGLSSSSFLGFQTQLCTRGVPLY